VSVEREFGESAQRFEELARWLAAIGEADVNLEVRLAAPHREPRHRQSRTPGECEQRVGPLERRGVRVMDGYVTPFYRLARLPLARHARERIAAGPAEWIERFELSLRSFAQRAADDERVAPAAQAAERPPRQIARFEEDDQRHAGKGSFGVADRHLDCGRAEPAHRGAAAEQGQAALHPAHERVSLAHVDDRAGRKPGDDRDRGDSGEPSHGGPHDSTTPARGWRRALREFFYGLSGYEITQQALEIRAAMETLFMLGVFGDMLGVPVLPPYYGLRLLPFVVPQIETWKRHVLRERELGSDHDHHLHGV